MPVAKEHFLEIMASFPSGVGLPHLHEDALAWAECETEQEVDAGDHIVLIGRVEAGEGPTDEDVPLMYYRRSWGAWTPARGGQPQA